MGGFRCLRAMARMGAILALRGVIVLFRDIDAGEAYVDLVDSRAGIGPLEILVGRPAPEAIWPSST